MKGGGGKGGGRWGEGFLGRLRGGPPAPFATSYIVGPRGQQNNAPSPKKINAVVGYPGPLKMELLKDIGLLLGTVVRV